MATTSVCWGLVGCVAVVTLGCAGQHAESLTPTRIRVSVGLKGGYFDAIGQALAETLRAEEQNYSVDVQTTSGAVGSIEAIEHGQSDCGYSYANIAYEAFASRPPDAPASLKQLRSVALVQISPLYFLVGHQSSVRSVADLRGRDVAFGLPESGTFRAAMMVLKAYGLGPQDIRIREESFRDSFASIQQGALDGMFILSGQPSDGVARAAGGGARIVPLVGPEIDRLREQYPFFRPSLIAAGTYPAQDTAVKTVGVETLLLCREDLDAGQVRRVTRAWFIALNRLVNDGLMSEAVSPKVASAVPIPLHSGAADYYRARQLLPE